MNKHRIATIVSVLFIVILCVSLFTACKKIERIEESQVEKVVVCLYNDGDKEYEMTSDEAKKFIELYNSSKYEGDDTDGCSTPLFGICIYFRDGTHLLIHEFEGDHVFYKLEGYHEFDVTFYNADEVQQAWYYISSEELEEFALEIVDKAKQNSG